jgi:hypothetical protein
MPAIRQKVVAGAPLMVLLLSVLLVVAVFVASDDWLADLRRPWPFVGYYRKYGILRVPLGTDTNGLFCTPISKSAPSKTLAASVLRKAMLRLRFE